MTGSEDPRGSYALLIVSEVSHARIAIIGDRLVTGRTGGLRPAELTVGLPAAMAQVPDPRARRIPTAHRSHRHPRGRRSPRSVPHPAVGAPTAPNHLASATSSVC